MESKSRSLDLKIPTQSLDALSFCQANTKAMQHWTAQLPMANIGETARRLYHAVIELNQLITPPANRLALLEIIRPPLHFVCKELSRHYLNQSISLPEKQRKIANLSQALQVHLATGYKIVMIDFVATAAPEKNRKPLAIAGHRIIREFGSTILRACQLYCNSPDRVWYELHQVFRFADKFRLRDLRVQDKGSAGLDNTTIDAPYKQVLLLGCCKPNQLRQNDLSKVYQAFEQWLDFVDVGRLCANISLFVVDSNKDTPPVYRSLLNETINDDYFGLDTNVLVNRITEYLDCVQQKKPGAAQYLPMTTRLPDQLVAHLGRSLGILTKRAFKRIASTGYLDLCAGISAAHYFCANKVDFGTFLLSGNQDNAAAFLDDTVTNRFLNESLQKSDVWSQAFDGAAGEPLSPPGEMINFDEVGNNSKKVNYKIYQIALVNTSPGGYCLQWRGEIPGSIQAGEILGVRENENLGWSIAAIRWIRQIKQQGTHIGIELLAPMALPSGVQLLQKTGENSEFLRGLMLPELSAIGQPATLITPRLPFQAGQKVMINNGESVSKCLLKKRISATSSFNQFELKYLETNSSVAQSPDTSDNQKQQSLEDDFDSLWPSL
ncbi:MAG: GTPase [Gammaproteobacteria bacterium]|nr:MAG: GTPase [Gammaproteobacteria bacterium]